MSASFGVREEEEEKEEAETEAEKEEKGGGLSSERRDGAEMEVGMDMD